MVYFFNMETQRTAGFREVEHTADWELEVWAPDLPGLLEQAARGMYALTGARLKSAPRFTRTIELQAYDRESLLVAFLDELLFFAEVEGLGFDTFEISVAQNSLRAQVDGAPLQSQSKEIKAVTYHGLAVGETERGLAANIVFDV
jgi:SHS2 domain-containing protein